MGNLVRQIDKLTDADGCCTGSGPALNGEPHGIRLPDHADEIRRVSDTLESLRLFNTRRGPAARSRMGPARRMDAAEVVAVVALERSAATAGLHGLSLVFLNGPERVVGLEQVAAGGVMHEHDWQHCTGCGSRYCVECSGFVAPSGVSVQLTAGTAASPEPDQGGAAPDPGLVERLREMVAFLCGEAPLNGVWFGDVPEGERGPFWWRKPLRELIAALTTAPGEAQEE